MSQQMVLELVGYAASVLVAVSLMMSSILRLRVINLVGSLAFTVYGALIGAYPVAAVNGFIVLINLYYLRQMLRTKEFFRLVSVRPDSEYIATFLSYHAAEIERFVPGFAFDPASTDNALFVLRDMMPAGLLLGRVHDGALHVALDFVIPQYRDFKIGRYLFQEEADFFRARGIRQIVAPAGNDQHAAYLRRMGFHPVPGDAGTYRLTVG